MNNNIRLRYAPSPTGNLHIGNTRTALFNFLFAKHYQGKFIIRIENTDIKRNLIKSEQKQLLFLKKLGITWDEGPDINGLFGPYRQLDRLSIYQKYTNLLLEKKLAYKEKTEENKFVVRFAVPKKVKYQFQDLVRGEVTFLSEDIEDWIILKENGIPTYNFAVVIDDFLMKISHVLRGEEHLTNTPKQIMIYQAFKWNLPIFGHLSIIVDHNKKKLSKRNETILQDIEKYLDLGYLPEALINFIALLGWSPEKNQDFFSFEELIKDFNEQKLNKAPATFDRQKLNFINFSYLKKFSIQQIIQKTNKYFIEEKIILKEEKKNILISLFKDRLVFLKQIILFYKQLFNFNLQQEKILKFSDLEWTIIISLKEKIENNIFSQETLKQIFLDIQQDLKIKGKDFYIPVRIALFGEEHGPNMILSFLFIGKKNIFSRLKKVLFLKKQ